MKKPRRKLPQESSQKQQYGLTHPKPQVSRHETITPFKKLLRNGWEGPDDFVKGEDHFFPQAYFHINA